MTFGKNIFQACIFCIFIFLPLTHVSAAQIINNDLLEFSLSIQNQTTRFNFPLNSYEVNADQLAINWYEPFSQYFHGGIELGYLEISQIENPLTSAKFSSGQFAGLLFRFLPLNTATISLTLNLNYRYNRTEGKSLSQNSQFAWHETLFFTELQFQPVDQISLFLAAEYQLLNGEQRDSGTSTQITPFSESKQQGYRFGINFKPYRTGIIGIEGFSGFRSGSRLYFTRTF